LLSTSLESRFTGANCDPRDCAGGVWGTGGIAGQRQAEMLKHKRGRETSTRGERRSAGDRSYKRM